MMPQEFIAERRAVELKERSASPAHFIELCKMPGGESKCDDCRTDKLTEDEIPARLFKLNQERAAAQ